MIGLTDAQIEYLSSQRRMTARRLSTRAALALVVIVAFQIGTSPDSITAAR